MRRILEKYARPLAVLWLLFITALFLLPGSALPKAGWLDRVFFDKWVHAGFFSLLLFLWRFYFPDQSRYHAWILLFALFYGMSVEAVQHYFVANRSFDLGDIAADMVGAVVGVWWWTKGYIKK